MHKILLVAVVWYRTVNGFSPGTLRESSSGDWSALKSESEMETTREADKNGRRDSSLMLSEML